MLKNGTIPNSATCPEIFAILIGPPSCELSPFPVIIVPKYLSVEVVTKYTSVTE